MGMRSVRSSFSALFMVAAVALAGCDSKPTNPPGSGSAVAGSPAGAPGAAGAAGAGQGGGDAGEAGEAPAAPACAPVLDIQPTSFFSARILLTLPKGVELIEQNPFFARSASADQVDSCGRPIPFAALGYVRSAASLTEIRRHVMGLHGFEDVAFSGESTQGDTTVATYDVDAGGTAIRGILLFKRDGGWYYWALYEAAPEDFPQVEPIYRQSFESLMIRPVREG